MKRRGFLMGVSGVLAASTVMPTATCAQYQKRRKGLPPLTITDAKVITTSGGRRSRWVLVVMAILWLGVNTSAEPAAAEKAPFSAVTANEPGELTVSDVVSSTESPGDWSGRSGWDGLSMATTTWSVR